MSEQLRFLEGGQEKSNKNSPKEINREKLVRHFVDTVTNFELSSLSFIAQIFESET